MAKRTPHAPRGRAGAPDKLPSVSGSLEPGFKLNVERGLIRSESREDQDRRGYQWLMNFLGTPKISGPRNG
jgi:hypothetical protein